MKRYDAESYYDGHTPEYGRLVERDDGEAVLFTDCAAALAAKDAELAKLKRRTEVYEAGLRDVLDLIGQSHGVDGLHKNGDVATWSELRAGGKFESWLSAFDAAVEEMGNV